MESWMENSIEGSMEGGYHEWPSLVTASLVTVDAITM